ncbi:unnamed protein product, partial [Callosobruchus maculatus]
MILLNKCIKYKLGCIQIFYKIESNVSILKSYLENLQTKLDRTKNKRYLVWQNTQTCFKNRIRSGVIVNLQYKDPKLFLKNAFKSFSIQVRKQLQKSQIIVNAAFCGEFIKPQTAETSLKHLTTNNQIIDYNIDLKNWYKINIIEKILKKFDDFQEKDSGWALLRILHLKVNINQYTPINIGISTYIEVPEFIKKSKSVINIKNNDSYCFLCKVNCSAC